MSEAGLYRVCGGALRSDLEFADLPRMEGDAAPTWTLSTPGGKPPPLDGEVLGEDAVTDTATVRLVRGPDCFRLDFSDTGVFDVSSDGRHIRWYPLPDSDRRAAALDVIGRVLAVCFHAGGLVCLHGSAVALDGGTIAFLAPKFHGKSTTALALTRSGGRLVTDDMLPVELVDPPRAHPGVHAVRLWEDSAEQVAAGDNIREGVGGKLVVDDLAADARMDEVSELRAVYLLQPVLDEPEAPAAERERTSSVESAMALVGQSKIGPLLGRTEAPVLLDRSLRLSELVPVYRLRLARDFERLPEVVAKLREWHDQPTGDSATAADPAAEPADRTSTAGRTLEAERG